MSEQYDQWLGGEEPDYPETAESSDEPTDADVLAIMSSPELMEEHGYRLTPKGHMGLVLMRLGMPKQQADTLSQIMSDEIFNAGWTYIPQESLDLEIPDDL